MDVRWSELNWAELIGDTVQGRLAITRYPCEAISSKWSRLLAPSSEHPPLPHATTPRPLLERTARAGYRFLSVGDQPIQRPFGRFVFAIDPDGVLVEFVEPTANVR